MNLTYENYKKIFASSGRSPMPLSKRAKIFSPFEAQNGLRSALGSKEFTSVTEPQLTELDKETLDANLQRIAVGDIITLVYQDNTHITESNPASASFLQITGKISTLDWNNQVLKVIDTSIPIKNIRSLSIISEPPSQAFSL